jgi:hypothetical protein
MFRILSYWFQWIAAFHSSTKAISVLFIVLCGICNCLVSYLWNDVCVSFEAALFKKAHKLITSRQSDNAMNAATKANRKATAIPDALEACLGLLIDQTLSSFIVFLKAGCAWPISCGSSAALLCLPLVLQLVTKTKELVSKVAAHRRRKETEL